MIDTWKQITVKFKKNAYVVYKITVIFINSGC